MAAAVSSAQALIRHPADGRVHVSELKQMAQSPAHYKFACEVAREMTDPMEVGHLTDCLVFGNKGYAVWDKNAEGKTVSNPVRRGTAYDDYRQSHAGELVCLPSQLAKAQAMAQAVLAHPLASKLLDGCEFQRVLQWEAYGLEFAAGVAGERGGLDAFNAERNDLTDLKACFTAEPDALSKHCWRMMYHAQLAAYLDGAVSRGLLRTGAIARLIVVESTPPHVVTVMRVPDDVLEEGRKSLSFWSERLRACDRTGHFPGYVESEVEMTIPEWERE